MRKTGVILCVLAFIGIGQMQAQSFKLGFGGGLNMGQSNPGYVENFERSASYNFGIKAKYGLSRLPITLTGQLSYNRFNFKGDYFDRQMTTGNGMMVSGDYEADVYTVGLGAEYSLAQGPISPYLGADIFYSESGQYTSHAGMGLGGGAEFKLLPMLGLDVSAKYNFYNLFGQSDREKDFNALSVTASIMFGF